MDPNTSGKNIDSFLVTVGGTNRQTAASVDQAREVLIPPTLNPETLVLPNFAGAIAPAGALGYNSAGLIAKGDGVTADGNPLVQRRITGTAPIDFTGLAKSGAVQRVVAIPIYAEEMVADTIVRITGSAIFRGVNLGSISQLYVGFAWENASTQLRDGAKGWVNADLHPNPGVNTAIVYDKQDFFFDGAIYDNGGPVALDSSTAAIFSTQVVYVDGTDPVNSSPAASFSSLATEDTPAGANTNLWLMYQIQATGGGNFGFNTKALVNYDFYIETEIL